MQGVFFDESGRIVRNFMIAMRSTNISRLLAAGALASLSLDAVAQTTPVDKTTPTVPMTSTAPSRPTQPTETTKAEATQTQAPKAAERSGALKVVLLLPLEHNMFRRAAMTVRDGVRAVFAKRSGAVNVLDCGYAQDGVVAAYQRCVTEATDWVIGPLGRSEVTALAAAKLTLRAPTLMLSPLGATPPTPFAILAPDLEAEAEAIAKQAVDDACRKPLLIEAQGAIAARLSVAYVSFWRGGGIATPLAQAEMGSRERWQRSADEWRRSGVDCVLFAGGGAALSELRPYLRGVTIYVTSATYESELDRIVDWSGVRIADAPFVIERDREAFVGLTFSGSGTNTDSVSPTLARLFALGADAAHLVLEAGRTQLPEKYDGAIGRLQLKDAQYQRTPMIGEFRGRAPTPVGR
jgi:uncharacterized protein